MPSFEPGDVVKVPFPYVERPVVQYRPALVVSSGQLQETHELVWLLMITSARNAAWAGDVPIANLDMAGLPAPSVVRVAKIATLQCIDATQIGKISQAERKLVNHMLRQILPAD